MWLDGRAEFSSNITKQGAEGQCGRQNSKMHSMILTAGCTCLAYDSYPGAWADREDVLEQWVPWLGYINMANSDGIVTFVSSLLYKTQSQLTEKRLEVREAVSPAAWKRARIQL